MSRTVTKNIDYIRKLYAPQDALLAEINTALKHIGMEIQLGSEEGKLLQLLISMMNIKTVVEIGTLGGYSALWMARALPEDGHLYTLEREAKHAALARDFFARSDVAERITLLEGNAAEMLNSLNDKAPFDMIFIDADKISYGAYLDWAEKHIKKGGLIVADNTLLFDTVAEDSPPEGVAPTTWQNMRRFNERLADPAKYCSVIVPTQEGMSVAIKLF